MDDDVGVVLVEVTVEEGVWRGCGVEVRAGLAEDEIWGGCEDSFTWLGLEGVVVEDVGEGKGVETGVVKVVEEVGDDRGAVGGCGRAMGVGEL